MDFPKHMSLDDFVSSTFGGSADVALKLLLQRVIAKMDEDTRKAIDESIASTQRMAIWIIELPKDQREAAFETVRRNFEQVLRSSVTITH